MKVVQVNIGSRKALQVGGETRQTGLYKEAVTGPIIVGEQGLEGDAICNRKHHGGPDQAVYLYSEEDYAWWGGDLAGPIPAGTFGENMTVNGIALGDVCPGDVLYSETLTLQVTAPRIPCSTLAARMGDKQFAKKFVQAERSGAYCRVLVTGTVTAGDKFELQPYDGDRISLRQFFVGSYTKLSISQKQRYLALPIDARTRAKYSGAI